MHTNLTRHHTNDNKSAGSDLLDLTMPNFVKKRKAKHAAAPKAAASVAPGHVLSDNQPHKLNMIISSGAYCFAQACLLMCWGLMQQIGAAHYSDSTNAASTLINCRI